MPSRRRRGKPDGETRVLRPEVSVLSGDALVPSGNIVEPPPNHFSHELTRDEPYSYGTEPSAASDGQLTQGTPVLLVAVDGSYARVIDPSGLYVRVRADSLRSRT